MRDSATDAKNLGKIAIFFLVAAIVCWIFRATTIAFLAAAVAAVFVLKCFVNVGAYLRCRKALLKGTESVEEQTEEDESDPVEVSQTVDLGNGFGVIKLAYDRKLYDKRRHCVEAIVNSIVDQRERFLLEYQRFLADWRQEYLEAAYLEEAEEFSILKINLVQITSSGRNQCVAWVYFAGEGGEHWYAKYDGTRFTDLIEIY